MMALRATVKNSLKASWLVRESSSPRVVYPPADQSASWLTASWFVGELTFTKRY